MGWFPGMFCHVGPSSFILFLAGLERSFIASGKCETFRFAVFAQASVALDSFVSHPLLDGPRLVTVSSPSLTKRTWVSMIAL